MRKLQSSIKKEILLLLSDKIGLSLMFLMPLLLVFVITIVQDSAYKIVNENKISLLVVNKDEGTQGEKLIENLKNSGMFDVSVNNILSEENMQENLIETDQLTCLFIPKYFSRYLENKASQVGEIISNAVGINETETTDSKTDKQNLIFYHDPVLDENYTSSIVNVVYSFVGMVENKLMIEQLCEELGIDEDGANALQQQIKENHIEIDKKLIVSNNSDLLPNSTQHNVPAWTIFAMFFMVISLGGNIVKEKLNGSFVRLRTVPAHFSIILASKMAVYIVAAVIQVALIFSLGKWVFPLIGLPTLYLPDNLLSFFVLVFFCSVSAVSYALVIGSFAKTQEQANGIGAFSIIILAALGGIWVPTFVMPEYLQTISSFSPLHWCLKGFYIVFLKNGSWVELSEIFIFLSGFIFCCIALTYAKLKVDKLI